MKKQSGITLIALVISIIVMLILAGVSINAIVGENGVLSKAQYSTFLNEMAAVEEAVGLWKAGELIDSKGETTTAIPANGLCKANDLTATERLVGEIGYYRVWSIGETMPSTNILSSASDFNSAFESEMVFYPAGVQDLYYLNNEALGLKDDKVYLIDASTSMVYSMTGISLNGVRCYSSHMAKAVMGNNVAPLFAEAEVSGTGSGEVLAGNVQSEYLEDGTLNPDYNPYGFKIVSSEHSDNIYKLYNNGDLYGKGIKGTQLNTDIDKLNEVNEFNWSKFTVPNEIGEYKEIISGVNTMFVIDNSGYLWAWGNNSSNKLGLTAEEQIDYTGREAIKLNVDGKTVKRVWGFGGEVYVLTEDNKLYGCGSNSSYQLGLGHANTVNSFVEIDIPNPEKIDQIYLTQERYITYIAFTDNTYYVSGPFARNVIGNGLSGQYTRFVPIWDGYVYKIVDGEIEVDTNYEYNVNLDINQDIKKITTTMSFGIVILKNDNTVWSIGSTTDMCRVSEINPETGETTTTSALLEGHISAIPENFGGTDVKNIYSVGYGILIQRNNGEIWAANWVYDSVGINGTTRLLTKVELPVELTEKGIKEIYTIALGDSQGAVFYLTNTNELYASANSNKITGGERAPKQIEKINAPFIESMYNVGNKVHTVNTSATIYTYGTNLFLGTDGNLYALGNKDVIFRDNILEKTWTKLASSVKDINVGYNNAIAYIDNNKDVYVAGQDSRMLGLNTSDANIVYNFTKITDSNIVGKAKKVELTYGQIYVITTDNKLYGSGIYSADGSTGWPNDRWPGWEELENHYSFIEIKDEVDIYGGNMYDKLLTSQDNIYFWGGDLLNSYINKARAPEVFEIDGIEASNIKKYNINRALGIILCNDGRVYLNVVYNSPLSDTYRWKYGKLNELFDNKKIVDFALDDDTAIFLDEDGNVWGFGSNKRLGISDSSNNITKVENAVKLSLINIQEISAGNGWFIAVSKVGRVFATGANTYGILGRWIGIDRNSPNSRYKTAFEWVECPELEI